MIREVIIVAVIVGASVVIAGRYTPSVFQGFIGYIVGEKHAAIVADILFAVVLVLVAFSGRYVWSKIMAAKSH